MAYISTTIDMKSVENVKEVIDVSIKGCVTAEIEVIGVDAARTDEVVANDAVTASEVRENPLPSGLVGAKTVSEDKDLVAGAFDADIECF